MCRMQHGCWVSLCKPNSWTIACSGVALCTHVLGVVGIGPSPLLCHLHMLYARGGSNSDPCWQHYSLCWQHYVCARGSGQLLNPHMHAHAQGT
jgi:hypothetical protein